MMECDAYLVRRLDGVEVGIRILDHSCEECVAEAAAHLQHVVISGQLQRLRYGYDKYQERGSAI